MAEANPLRCPFCGTVYDEPFAICVHCGMDRRTGRMHEPTRVEEDDEESKPPKSLRVAAWIAEYFPGLFRPLVLISAIILAAAGLAITVFGLVLTFGLFVIITGIIATILGSMIYAQAVAWILWGELGMLTDQLTEFDETRWALFFTGLLTPGTLLILVARYAL